MLRRRRRRVSARQADPRFDLRGSRRRLLNPTIGKTAIAVATFSVSSLASSSAFAAGQATAANAPAELRPAPTGSNHEIGASLNGAFNPDSFMPLFNWRVHFPQTGRIGVLSGLYLGVDVGPAVGFGGGVWGHVGVELGYEIDPWSNLALTFSPVIHNDTHFSPRFFQFSQTFGPAVRLYINQHWVVFFEPGHVGWTIRAVDRDLPDDIRIGAGFSFRGGAGFAYKF